MSRGGQRRFPGAIGETLRPGDEVGTSGGADIVLMTPPCHRYAPGEDILEMHSQHIHMWLMNWGVFDLNLLVVFDAVMQERNITRAGERIGLSQPAVSHDAQPAALYAERSFRATPEGMVPTPRAEQAGGSAAARP